MSDIVIAILAGGQSRRMGRDKSRLLLDDRPLITHVRDRAAALGLPLLLISNTPAAHAFLGLPIYPDRLPGCGPLGGIHTALHAVRGADVICLACDMPFIEPGLLRQLIAVRNPAAWAIVPVIAGQPQPLCALYRPACLPTLEAHLQARHFKLTRFLAEVPVQWIDEAAVRQADPALGLAVNINTPDDLRQAAARSTQ